MQRIILASRNPVKARATLEGFQQMFPQETFYVHTASVASGLSPQPPLSSAATLHGACERY